MQPAVYMIFTLLNALRRGVPRSRMWLEFRRQKIRLHPRLSFWLALCRSAHLITETDLPLITQGFLLPVALGAGLGTRLG